MGRGGSVHCGMLGNFAKSVEFSAEPDTRINVLPVSFPLGVCIVLQLSKTKQNEKKALVRLAFPINAHQNAIQKPIRSAPTYRVQCTLPPQPIYQTFFNFSRVWFRDQRSVGMHLAEKHFEIRHSEMPSVVIFHLREAKNTCNSWQTEFQ